MCICNNAPNMIYAVFELWDTFLLSKLSCLCEGQSCSPHQYHQHFPHVIAIGEELEPM